MFNDIDTNKEIALSILKYELNIVPIKIMRFTTGYCHNVYYVETETDKFVLRITSEENKRFYDGSVKWLRELTQLDIPIPKMLKHGRYNDVYYALITYICGKDLGEVYHTLSDSQKHDIAKDIAEIQRKVSTLPPAIIDGSDSYSPATCMGSIENCIRRSRENIMANKVFSPRVCDTVSVLANTFKGYLIGVKPMVFLDDISTKNVLINNGKLAGIVDIDEIGYGDSLGVVGLTNMALLAMKTDTIYVDYLLEEIQANAIQKKAIIFYTLLFCIDFMGERGTKFDNGKIIPVNQDEVELFNSIYNKLLTML